MQMPDKLQKKNEKVKDDETKEMQEKVDKKSPQNEKQDRPIADTMRRSLSKATPSQNNNCVRSSKNLSKAPHKNEIFKKNIEFNKRTTNCADPLSKCATEAALKYIHQDKKFIEEKLNKEVKIQCFSCLKILIMDKTKGDLCKVHTYCGNCIKNPSDLSKIKSECEECFNQFQNRIKKKQASPIFENKELYSRFPDKNDYQHQPKIIHNTSINKSILSETLSYESPVKFHQPNINNSNEQFFVNPIEKKTVQNCLCMKCKKIPSENQLLCTHSVCLLCLINCCCTKIFKFFSEYQQNSSIINHKFYYQCPVEDCNQEIFVPTKMIIENFHKYYSSPDLNFDLKLFETWIPYFDGIPFLIEFNYNKNDQNFSEKTQNLIGKSEIFLRNNLNKPANNDIVLTESVLAKNLKSNCYKCNNSNEVTAFLCNHNICKECLTYSCCLSIKDFLIQYKICPAVINFRFDYSCPVCYSKISVPTNMIIKNYINCFKTVEKFKKFEEIMEYLVNNKKDFERLICYFDGLCIALE